MKENKYDDAAFFEAYSKFPRSAEGLSAAGEWHALQKMLPPLKGKRVLDVGCGFGWHAVYAADEGASRVLGIDISRKMLAEAARKNPHPQVEYRHMAMEDMDFAPDSFDVVISSLAFHYTPDFEDVSRRIAHCLAPGGRFVFSAEHPVFTSNPAQDWVYDGAGSPLYWPVDGYFKEGRRDTRFLGEPVVKYHRTLTAYLNALLKSGFQITGFTEPQPAPHLLDAVPGMREELRRPMMLIISAQKQG